MKVLDFGRERLDPTPQSVDLNRCTRCGQAWGFELVERVEIWKCDRCGYEAREKSVDSEKAMAATQRTIQG